MDHVVSRYALRLNDFGPCAGQERHYKVWFDGLVQNHSDVEMFVSEIREALNRHPAIVVALFEPSPSVTKRAQADEAVEVHEGACYGDGQEHTSTKAH